MTNKQEHKLKMDAKKEARKTLKAGFTQVTNVKNSAFVNGMALALGKSESNPDGIDLKKAFEQAWNALRSKLSPLPIGIKLHRIKPTKNNNPEYRK